MVTMNKKLYEEFIKIYGESDQPIRVFKSPGRVNLIGEHIDYNGGYVFPAALSMATTVLVRKRNDNIIRLYATDLKYVVQAELDRLDYYKDYKWGNYQLGVAAQLIAEGYSVPGCEMLFEDKVPLGSGLSSSAAFSLFLLMMSPNSACKLFLYCLRTESILLFDVKHAEI